MIWAIIAVTILWTIQFILYLDLRRGYNQLLHVLQRFVEMI